MNTYFALLVFSLCLINFPIAAYSAGSSINNSRITNISTIKNSTNTSVGGLGKAEANQGSVVIKGAKLNNATIVNNASVKNSSNIARSAEANQGSIKVSKSLSGVTVVNNANVSNSANVAVGGLLNSNSSDQGSIIFK